jgi:hypothetical protein
MNPQGSSLINADHFKNLAKSLKGAESCEELQVLVDEAMSSISAVEDAIASELAKANALLALLVVPGANLGQIVTWITNVVNNFLTPLVKPTITFPAQLAEITLAIQELKDAIDSLKLQFPNCSISY